MTVAPAPADYARAEVDHETIALTAMAWSELADALGFTAAATALRIQFERHYSLSYSCNRRY